MIPQRGKGAELREMLCRELGVDPGERWFEVRFAMGEPVTVRWPLETQTLRLSPEAGPGRALCDALRGALSVPERARSFSVRFAVGEVVTVCCEYLPTEEIAEDAGVRAHG